MDRDILIIPGIVVTPDVSPTHLSPKFFDKVMVETLNKIGDKARDGKGARVPCKYLVMSFVPVAAADGVGIDTGATSDLSVVPYGFVIARDWCFAHLPQPDLTLDCRDRPDWMAGNATHILLISLSTTDEARVNAMVREFVGRGGVRSKLVRHVVLDAGAQDKVAHDSGAHATEAGVRRGREGGEEEEEEEEEKEEKTKKRSRHDT